MNLSMNLVPSAERFPDHTALDMDDQALTYAQLDEVTARLADRMTSMGIGPGDRIGAAVVLKAGADASPAELSQYVKSRLAAYKYPRRVWLADSLPKGPTGKILRREVKIPEADQA